MARGTHNKWLQEGVQKLSSILVRKVAAFQFLFCCGIPALVYKLIPKLWWVILLLVPFHGREVSAGVTDALQGKPIFMMVSYSPYRQAVGRTTLVIITV